MVCIVPTTPTALLYPMNERRNRQKSIRVDLILPVTPVRPKRRQIHQGKYLHIDSISNLNSLYYSNLCTISWWTSPLMRHCHSV
ncbi:hypothetical protein PROFUN_06502 [Planoprotostelium fungivorum]|uniref:Uncharacterized protein n=1 Tax=Planoprotostelium fungivorum TaxID=1890364 RepID=A0A2P6NP38_9EUKA|nr:hypothetical protein PROFUN_06502 [Planoprotostelium fungivorum]